MDVSDFYKRILKISHSYNYQKKVWELFQSQSFPILIKAPTGSGKTEAVIAPFLNQFLQRKISIAPRLIYVLPMRVLVNSLTKRIKDYTNTISPSITVQIQHGALPDTPFFISDIVVTTLDQFLYGFARSSLQVGKHIDLPAGSIASSIVVFDEAHMYRDEFTFSIMRALMEILYESKIPFVVMTATMPECLERSLFENIPLSENQKVAESLPFHTTVSLKIEREPLITDSGEVNISDSLLRRIKNHKTLIVLNQVKKATTVYEEIKKLLRLNEEQIVLLHSRFTKIDRDRHENKALSLLTHKGGGELRVPEGTGIVVSTQVLEAGIDFSAELLLTELAPADCLVQRAGRCARYKDEKGEMIIFPLEGDRYFLPYEKRHVEDTITWLERNNNFNIKDFNQVCNFVNETLDYKANDFEASDTLIDLYECVLYADTKPENIQLRKDKYAKVLVIEPKTGERKKEDKKTQIENSIRDILKARQLAEFSFEVDIKVLWGWFKNGLIRYELKWKEDKKGIQPEVVDLRTGGKEPSEEDQRISPFKTYIIESSNYNPEKGVVKDEALFI